MRAMLLGVVLLAIFSLTGCPLRVTHYHDAHCGHYYARSRWTYADSHHHHGGCGHYYYDGRWWADPPRASVVISSHHVCHHSCGHYYHGGRRYFHSGHVHGIGCGHRFAGGLWIVY